MNYLFDKVFRNTDISTSATKKLQIEKGRKWQISNVTLWEIFLTKNENRRYQLFDFSRSLFHDTLICSIEELTVNYLTSGCPLHEFHYEIDSKAVFSKEWNFACKNLEYFFQPDREQLEYLTHHFRFLGEYFVKTNKGFSLQPYGRLDQISDKLHAGFLKYIHEEILKLCHTPLDEQTKNYVAYAMQVVMIILCFGIGFDQPTIERFWNKDGKTEPLERLGIAIEKFPDIFFRGPLSNITKMILLQSNNKTGRGLYFDSLQSAYTSYSDLFITNDKHFLKYKEENKIDLNMAKVMEVKDLHFGLTKW